MDPEQLLRYLILLAPLIRDRLSLTSGRRWLSPDPSPTARQAAIRLRQLIAEAARLRQHDLLLQLEQMLGFVARGHTAGEEMLIERVVEAPARELTSRLSRVTTSQPNWNGIEVRLTGLIVFGSDHR